MKIKEKIDLNKMIQILIREHLYFKTDNMRDSIYLRSMELGSLYGMMEPNIMENGMKTILTELELSLSRMAVNIEANGWII